MNERKMVVMYRGGLAFYHVSSKESGQFHAHLTRYDGKTKDAPLSDVLLSKVEGRWIANCDVATLVQDLGALIEQKYLGYLSPHSK